VQIEQVRATLRPLPPPRPLGLGPMDPILAGLHDARLLPS